MISPRSPRLSVATAALFCVALLTGCAAPLGGVDTLPTSEPVPATFTSLPDAMPAPPVLGELVDGTEVDLSKLWSERVLVLQFTSSWCTQCAAAEPELTKVFEDYQGAVLPVRIALNEPGEDIMKYLSSAKAVGPAVVDTSGSIWRDYAVTEPPVTAIIDTEGGLVRMWPGGTESEQLRAVLDELITLE